MITQATKSKTMWFSALLTAFGLIEANMGLFTDMLGPYGGHFSIIVAAIVGALRAVTKVPLSEK